MPQQTDVHELATRVAVIERLLDQHPDTCPWAREVDGMEKALKLQAVEYSRRLDALNGEAERLRQMQATFVPRELWQAEHLRVVVAIDQLNSFRDQATGRQSILAVLISAAVSLFIGFVVHAWAGK